MIDYFLEKCGCIGNSSSLSVNLQIESLEIEEVIPPENIRISINIKFNLNCTTFLPGDSLYLLKKPEKMEEKLKNEDLDPQLIIKLEGRSLNYEGSVQSQLTLLPNIYYFVYIRSPIKYDQSKKIWRILGCSNFFKLDLVKNNLKTSFHTSEAKAKKIFKTPNKFLDLTKLNSTNIDSLSEWKTLKKDIIEEDTYCNSHYSQTSLLKKNKENLMFSSRISKTPSLNTKFGSGKKSNEETFVEMNKNQIENFFKEIELRKNEEEPPNEVINCEKLDSGKKKGHNHSSSKNSFQDKVKRLK